MRCPQKPFLIPVPKEKTHVGMSYNFPVGYIFMWDSISSGRAQSASVKGNHTSLQGTRASSCQFGVQVGRNLPVAVPLDGHKEFLS